MSVRYVTVQWTRPKMVYDAIAIGGIALYVLVFRAIGRARLHGAEALSREILDMRAWGSCAFVLLTIILCIGPLARLDRRFAPLLYNRRHLGVLTCGVALMHAWQVLWYHLYGSVPPEVSMLVYDTSFTPASVPFPLLGMTALLILLVLATTSHDFWQRFYGPASWKWIHMSIYAAYLAVVGHVMYGVAQSETAALAAIVGLAALAVVGLHLAASARSSAPDRARLPILELDGERWIDGGPVDALREGHAAPVCPPGQERIALIRHEGKLSAIHGVCAHQGGPLYEGRVIDGCLTCPWHGWQYRPGDGQSPPPFTEKVPTCPVRVREGRVLVRLRALPPGTATEPVLVAGQGVAKEAS